MPEELPTWPEEPGSGAMEARFRAAREAAEARFRRYRREIAEELARNLADTFDALPETPSAAPHLADLAVADLHRLEQADSRVRHSIVQACFYNLRLYSALLPDRRDRPAFQEKLRANLAHLPGIREELARYFAVRVGGVPAGAFFPRQRAVVMEQLKRLSELADDLPNHYHDEACVRLFAERAPGHIDRIMRALGEITSQLRAVKIDLVDLLEELVALHSDRLAEAGIALRFTNEGGETAPLFGRRRDLTSAFGELINNAARHGLAPLPPGRPRLISIVLRLVTLGQQTYQVDIADSGRGIPPEVQEHLGTPGVTSGGTGFGLSMVRRTIETDHLGTLDILSREGTGTLVRIHLPRTLAPPI